MAKNKPIEYNNGPCRASFLSPLLEIAVVILSLLLLLGEIFWLKPAAANLMFETDETRINLCDMIYYLITWSKGTIDAINLEVPSAEAYNGQVHINIGALVQCIILRDKTDETIFNDFKFIHNCIHK